MNTSCSTCGAPCAPGAVYCGSCGGLVGPGCEDHDQRESGSLEGASDESVSLVADLVSQMSRDPWPGWIDEAREYAEEQGLSASQFDSVLKAAHSLAQSQAQVTAFVDGSTVTGFQVGRSCQLRVQVRNQGKRGLKSVSMELRATCLAGQAEVRTRSIGPGRSSVLTLTITPTLAGQHVFECILHASDYGQTTTHFLIEGITFEVAPEEVSAATVINHTTVDFGDVRAADQSGMVIGGGGARQRDARLFVDGDWIEVPVRVCGAEEAGSWASDKSANAALASRQGTVTPSSHQTSSEFGLREGRPEVLDGRGGPDVEGRSVAANSDAEVPTNRTSAQGSNRSRAGGVSEDRTAPEASWQHGDRGRELPVVFKIVSLTARQSEVVRLLCDEAGLTLLEAVRGLASLPLKVCVDNESDASQIVGKLRGLGVEVAVLPSRVSDAAGPEVLPTEQPSSISFGQCSMCSKLGETAGGLCAGCRLAQSSTGQPQSTPGANPHRPALLISTIGKSRVELISALAEITSSSSGRIAELLSVFPSEVPLGCTRIEAEFAVSRLKSLGVDVRLLP